MGDVADMILDDALSLPSEYPVPEDYLGMTDDELRAATSSTRTRKLVGIRKWLSPLSAKQRYCLACWLAERDLNY